MTRLSFAGVILHYINASGFAYSIRYMQLEYGILIALLAGLLWYSQFFGLSLGRSFFEPGSSIDTLAFCILMALNVTFSNLWGVVLKEWRGCSKRTVIVLIAGIVILIFSSFLPELM